MIDPVPEFVEEMPAEDGKARMVVLFGGAGPDLLEELCEKSRDVQSGGSRPGRGSSGERRVRWTER